MPSSTSRWPFRAMQILIPIAGLLLVVQYVAGLYTNAYSPASGFTSNTAYPALNLHYTVGMALGILAIIVVIVSAFTREIRYIGLSVVMLAAILVAGFAGMAFVGTTPNPPIDTVIMGSGFLIAFWATVVLGFTSMMGGRMSTSSSPPATVAT
ncbi:MAG: hypothetical protein WAN87_03815 [Thermoplasmata archaeon]